MMKKGQKYPEFSESRKNELNPSWKGGRYLHKGYWYIKKHNYFNTDKNNYIAEHIYNFQEYHKCCMLPWGVVHHKDFNRSNNEISNLEGMMASKHIEIHHIKNMDNRICSKCGSDKTNMVTQKSGRKTPHWYKINNGFYCLRCYDKLHYLSKKYNIDDRKGKEQVL